MYIDTVCGGSSVKQVDELEKVFHSSDLVFTKQLASGSGTRAHASGASVRSAHHDSKKDFEVFLRQIRKAGEGR